MKNIIFIIFTLIIFSCSRKGENYDYIISNINILDVKEGKIIKKQNVGIKGQFISKISEGTIPGSDNSILIDGTGKFLMPGLWDMHVHYYWNYSSTTSLYLNNGVVGIREMFGDLSVINRIKDSINRKVSVGPEIISSGRIIDGFPPTWLGSDTITILERAEDLIERQVFEKADFLKVYDNLSRECYFSIAKLANEKQIDFAGHLPDGVTIWEAINSNQKSIEHFDGFLEGCSKSSKSFNGLKEINNWPNPDYLSYLIDSFNETKFDSLVKILSKSNTWLCPTLVVLNSFSNLSDTAFTNDKRLKYLPKEITESWSEMKFNDPGYFLYLKKIYSFQKNLLGRIQKAGVKIIAGTDSPNPYCFPGFSIHDELDLMVQGGMSNIEALKAATLNPALYLKLDTKYGTISEGKYASVIILNKNPIEDVKNTKSISTVFIKGTPIANSK